MHHADTNTILSTCFPPLTYSYRLTQEAARSNQREYEPEEKKRKNEQSHNDGGVLHYEQVNICKASPSGIVFSVTASTMRSG